MVTLSRHIVRGGHAVGVLCLGMARDPSAPNQFVAHAATASPVAARQQPTPGATETGRELFATYCASCHGPNGRGGGPIAAQLRHEVPDLTKFSMRNNGMFPSVRVQRIIDGTGIASHGTREMPVWGDAFKRMRGTSADSAAARIEALTKYLESIQERAGE